MPLAVIVISMSILTINYRGPNLIKDIASDETYFSMKIPWRRLKFIKRW